MLLLSIVYRGSEGRSVGKMEKVYEIIVRLLIMIIIYKGIILMIIVTV